MGIAFVISTVMRREIAVMTYKNWIAFVSACCATEAKETAQFVE